MRAPSEMQEKVLLAAGWSEVSAEGMTMDLSAGGEEYDWERALELVAKDHGLPVEVGSWLELLGGELGYWTDERMPEGKCWLCGLMMIPKDVPEREVVEGVVVTGVLRGSACPVCPEVAVVELPSMMEFEVAQGQALKAAGVVPVTEWGKKMVRAAESPPPNLGKWFRRVGK